MKKTDEPKREKRLPSLKLSSICTEQKKGLLGTWKSIAHHPLHNLSAQGWIIKQTGLPRLESVWNLAILCDLCILCVTAGCHWKTLSYLWRSRKQHWKSRSKKRWYEKTQHISFSKNIYWDICFICKGDLVRSWRLRS